MISRPVYLTSLTFISLTTKNTGDGVIRLACSCSELQRFACVSAADELVCRLRKRLLNTAKGGKKVAGNSVLNVHGYKEMFLCR
jgi:hypothetical protein